MNFQVGPNSLQLNEDGTLRHFLSIEGLTRDQLVAIMDRADGFLNPHQTKHPLTDFTIVNLFYESSTRTRCSFELAEKRLGAHALNLDIKTSASCKGETMLDTVRNLQAMGGDLFVVRHSEVGAVDHIARNVESHVHVLNAGDGCRAHPTQAMLDMLTIRHNKGDFSKLRVAIVGDLLHSRVARSDIHALRTLGTKEIRIIAPTTLLPKDCDSLGVTPFDNMEEGISGVDVIMTLRLQKERMQQALIPNDSEFYHRFGLSQARLALAKPDAMVMHPGPMNRGVEIASDVADGPQSVILQQVNYGIATRMAIMAMCLGR